MENIQINADGIWSRIKKLAKDHKVTLEQAYLSIGVNPQVMKNKKARKAFPSVQELASLALYFESSMDYIVLGESDNPLLKPLEERYDKLAKIKQMVSQSLQTL